MIRNPFPSEWSFRVFVPAIVIVGLSPLSLLLAGNAVGYVFAGMIGLGCAMAVLSFWMVMRDTREYKDRASVWPPQTPPPPPPPGPDPPDYDRWL